MESHVDNILNDLKKDDFQAYLLTQFTNVEYISGYRLLVWLQWVLVVVCRIFSCRMWDLVPRPGIKPRALALGEWSLSHWTTEEVPQPERFLPKSFPPSP